MCCELQALTFGASCLRQGGCHEFRQRTTAATGISHGTCNTEKSTSACCRAWRQGLHFRLQRQRPPQSQQPPTMAMHRQHSSSRLLPPTTRALLMVAAATRNGMQWRRRLLRNAHASRPSCSLRCACVPDTCHRHVLCCCLLSSAFLACTPPVSSVHSVLGHALRQCLLGMHSLGMHSFFVQPVLAAVQTCMPSAAPGSESAGTAPIRPAFGLLMAIRKPRWQPAVLFMLLSTSVQRTDKLEIPYASNGSAHICGDGQRARSVFRPWVLGFRVWRHPRHAVMPGSKDKGQAHRPDQRFSRLNNVAYI